MSISKEIEEKSFDRKTSILNSKTDITVSGRAYYVANTGDDSNPGTIEKPWQTLKKVSETEFQEGDGVFFRRGDIFRGQLRLMNNVTYSAYGIGEKPKIFGSPENGANPYLWEEVDRENHIWKYKKPMRDVGLIVFNEGEIWTKKIVTDYKDGKFVKRKSNGEIFNPLCELKKDLEMFCTCDSELKPDGTPTRNALGELFLRCEKGNPGKEFFSAEFNTIHNVVEGANAQNVVVDNLCVKYGGSHGIGAGCVRNLMVQNCEIGWIGGAVQFYDNGMAVRYGNGVEVYSECDGYYVKNNYIYQCYDAGVTHQQSAHGEDLYFKNVEYKGNLIEDCIYSIEYFFGKNQNEPYIHLMSGITIEDNILRRAGYGFGKQRPDYNFASHILGWWTTANDAENFVVKNNIFDRSTHYLIQIHAEQKESLPVFNKNIYVQKENLLFGRFGEKLPGGFAFAETQLKYDVNIKLFIHGFDRKAVVHYI